MGMLTVLYAFLRFLFQKEYPLSDAYAQKLLDNARTVNYGILCPILIHCSTACRSHSFLGTTIARKFPTGFSRWAVFCTLLRLGCWSAASMRPFVAAATIFDCERSLNALRTSLNNAFYSKMNNTHKKRIIIHIIYYIIMFPTLEDIGKKRRQLGLKQAELANSPALANHT
jgi:hypothetical protein